MQKGGKLLTTSLLIIVFLIVVALVWVAMYKVGLVTKYLHSGKSDLPQGSTCTLGKNECKRGFYCYGIIGQSQSNESDVNRCYTQGINC